MEGCGESGLVSVIIPAYNREELIGETLDSVLGQTYRPIELIVVDDGSLDATPERVKEWSELHDDADFIVIVESQENQGSSAARNHGLAMAQGEFVQFLDSDDTLHRDKIRKQVELLALDPDLAFVYGGMVFLGSEKPTAYHNGTMGIEESIDRCVSGEPGIFHTMSPLFRKQAFGKVGTWCEKLVMYDDVDLAAKFFCRDVKYLYCPESISYLRQNDGREQLTRRPRTRDEWLKISSYRIIQLRNLWAMLPQWYLMIPSHRSLYSRALLGALKQLLLQGGSPPEESVALLAKAAEGTDYRQTVTLFRLLARLLGWHWGAKCFSLVEGLYAKMKRSLKGTVKR